MKRVVVISGAGISAESGLKTFRGADGLWRGYRPEEVACPEAWRRNPGLVFGFYNERRKAVREAQPNAAHRALVELERAHDVRIVTQNVDDLHERAGSTRVLHLHGEIRKARSTLDPTLVTHLGDGDINLGDRCAQGSQIRPHIVWFGESVRREEPGCGAGSARRRRPRTGFEAHSSRCVSHPPPRSAQTPPQLPQPQRRRRSRPTGRPRP